MSLVLDLLKSLGAGESVVVAAVLLLGGWYLLKGVRLGKLVGAALGSITAYVVAGLIILGLATGLGFFDPRPDAFFNAVDSARGFAADHADVIIEYVRGLLVP